MALFGLWPRRSRAPARSGARAYLGASNDRLLADIAEYAYTRSANAELRPALRTLRNRSRFLCQNNDYARALLRLVRRNVVGPTGFGLQMRVPASRGEGFDENANGRIEDAWARWSRRGVCTVDGGLSRADFERLFIEHVVRDGEVLVRLVRGWRANRWRFAVQLIEIDRLDEDLQVASGAAGPIANGVRMEAGNEIRMGVERDAWERPAAYWLRARHPGDDLPARASERWHRVPAVDVIHAFLPERAHAARGVPWMYAGLRRLVMLGGYEEAELVAARNASSKMGFYVSEAGDDPSQVAPDATDAQGRRFKDVEPGTFEALPPGVQMQTFDPQHPTQAFPAFVKSMLRGFSTGCGVSYNAIAGDLESVNYSSLRHGAIEDRDEWRVLQSWMIDALARPVFEAWLDAALLSGEIGLPAAAFDRWNSPLFVARGWQWVDPAKDIEADIKAVQLGVKTRSQICAERGLDFEDVVRQLAREQALAEELGITVTPATAAPAPVPAAKEEPDDDE